jgi:hypothetical protein
MDCDSSEDTAELQQQRPAWVRICADEFAAVVSTAKIFAAHPASLLASLIDLELSSQQQQDPCVVRLDCSADVAKVRTQHSTRTQHKQWQGMHAPGV